MAFHALVAKARRGQGLGVRGSGDFSSWFGAGIAHLPGDMAKRQGGWVARRLIDG